MRKALAAAVVVALVGGGAYLAFGQGIGVAGSAARTPTPIPAVKADDRVVAEGKVVPLKAASLGLPSGGIVKEVLVSEGDTVAEGQVLVRVDPAKQQVAVAQAEASLKRAEANLEQVKSGARAQEIEAARAGVAAAEAQLAKAKAGPRKEEVDAAQAALVAARAQLAKVQEGPERDVVVAAEGNLQKLKLGATPEEIRGAELAIEQSKSALWSAQTERDGVCGSPVPQYRCDAANASVSAAEMAVKTAENNLAKLKAGARAEDVATAQAKLDELKKGASGAAVENARSQVEAAQAKLETLKSGARTEELAALEAEVRRAKAQLSLVEAGARKEAVAAAEADVLLAKAALEQAKVTLGETELKAPFPGEVVELAVKVGESVVPGTVVLKVADVTEWRIETTDLTELAVVKVVEGAPVVVTLDALPGIELAGKVVKVKTLGENRNGDITYKVTIAPDGKDARLRWNMTTSVSIKPQ